ncbi:MAG: hypothetical protein DHS20C03_07550 [Minwuia thermotolerans]|nr:MAG: hypothetical protein DHS20C03_07550 [Minwuia thermotolerans]
MIAASTELMARKLRTDISATAIFMKGQSRPQTRISSTKIMRLKEREAAFSSTGGEAVVMRGSLRSPAPAAIPNRRMGVHARSGSAAGSRIAALQMIINSVADPNFRCY